MKDLPDTSPKGELNKTDWKKIAIGASVAIAGAALTAFAEYVATVDFGTYTAFIGAGMSVLINTIRKALAGTNQY